MLSLINYKFYILFFMKGQERMENKQTPMKPLIRLRIDYSSDDPDAPYELFNVHRLCSILSVIFLVFMLASGLSLVSTFQIWTKVCGQSCKST